MALDFDLEMLLYLGIITVGVFLAPLGTDPPYYTEVGLGMIGAGVILAYRKIKR